MKKLFFFFIFSYFVFNYSWLAAQNTKASVAGTVTDQQNSVLAGATVQVKNESTGFTTSTLTNAKGEYLFKELPLGGPYTVIISFIGYAEQRQTGYMLHQGDAIRVKTSMQETNQSLEAVEVVASSLKNQVENL